MFEMVIIPVLIAEIDKMCMYIKTSEKHNFWEVLVFWEENEKRNANP